jgi:PAS domain S-box-containing protein
MDRATNRILDHTLIGEAMLTAGVAILVSDDDGNYIAVNDAAEELLGYSREEFRKLKAHEVTARSAEELSELMRDMNRRRAIEGTAKLRRKDGVFGTIRYSAFAAKVGGLPVLVSVTAPIDEFEAYS